jgi:hypothetical protein
MTAPGPASSRPPSPDGPERKTLYVPNARFTSRSRQEQKLFAEFGERGSLVHGDMIRRVALDLVLRFISTRVDGVPLELDGLRHDARDATADATCLRIPGDVVSAL